MRTFQRSYYAIASDKALDPRISHVTLFFLQYLDGPNSISFSPAQTSFTVTEGSQLDVQCMADCHPNCTYRWYYSYSHSHGSHSQGVWIDSPRFHMRHADFYEAGTYTCKASNPQTHHEYRKHFTLHVVGKYYKAIRSM